VHLPLFNHHAQIVGACVFGVRVDIGVGVGTPDAAKVTLAPSFPDPLSSAAVTSDVGAGEGGGTVVALVVTELEASLLVVVEMVPSVLVV
jgi:hypothetical protein